MTTNDYKHLHPTTNVYHPANRLSLLHLCGMELRKSFIQGQMYHVYNCGNGNEPIFRCEQNYQFFLNKYHKHMDGLWQTHAWCLLPGEFHFIITVKDNPLGTTDLTRLVSRTFGDFCNGYVQAYNKFHVRKGSLLRRAFKRNIVHRADAIVDLTCSMHNTPVLEKLAVAPEDWQYSSYAVLSRSSQTEFRHHPVLRLFGSKSEFIRRHKIQMSIGPIDLRYEPAA